VPRHKSKYTEEIVLKEISKFFDKHGRIPVKREMYGCYKVARKYFGTWNIAIKTAGFQPNPVMFAKKYFAKDGDKCDSLAEKIIDDWLFMRKVKHKTKIHFRPTKDLSLYLFIHPSYSNKSISFIVSRSTWIDKVDSNVLGFSAKRLV